MRRERYESSAWSIEIYGDAMELHFKNNLAGREAERVYLLLTDTKPEEVDVRDLFKNFYQEKKPNILQRIISKFRRK